MFQHQGAIISEPKIQKFASANTQSWYYDNERLQS